MNKYRNNLQVIDFAQYECFALAKLANRIEPLVEAGFDIEDCQAFLEQQDGVEMPIALLDIVYSQVIGGMQ